LLHYKDLHSLLDRGRAAQLAADATGSGHVRSIMNARYLENAAPLLEAAEKLVRTTPRKPAKHIDSIYRDGQRPGVLILVRDVATEWNRNGETLTLRQRVTGDFTGRVPQLDEEHLFEISTKGGRMVLGPDHLLPIAKHDTTDLVAQDADLIAVEHDLMEQANEKGAERRTALSIRDFSAAFENEGGLQADLRLFVKNQLTPKFKPAPVKWTSEVLPASDLVQHAAIGAAVDLKELLTALVDDDEMMMSVIFRTLRGATHLDLLRSMQVAAEGVFSPSTADEIAAEIGAHEDELSASTPGACL
jgi:hypothetical protein